MYGNLLFIWKKSICQIKIKHGNTSTTQTLSYIKDKYGIHVLSTYIVNLGVSVQIQFYKALTTFYYILILYTKLYDINNIFRHGNTFSLHLFHHYSEFD